MGPSPRRRGNRRARRGRSDIDGAIRAQAGGTTPSRALTIAPMGPSPRRRGTSDLEPDMLDVPGPSPRRRGNR